MTETTTTRKQQRSEAYRKNTYARAARNALGATLKIAKELKLTSAKTVKLFQTTHDVLVERIEAGEINDPVIDGAIAEALRRNQ